MKEKNFLKHFVVIGGGTFLNLLLGIITTPLITRIVNPIEYGQFSIFTMYSNIALMVLCMGLDQAVVRYYYENKKVEYKRALLFRCVKLPVIVSIICSMIIIMSSITNTIIFEFNSLIMILLCIYTVVQIIYRFSLLIVRLEYKSKLYSSLNILLKAVYVMMSVPMLLIFKQDYLLLLVISTVSSTIICMIVSVFAQSKMWNFFEDGGGECIISKKELIMYAYPYIISMGITTLFQTIDKISLNYYCTYTEVGIYSSTMTLVHIFAVVQTTFNTLWTPMAVEHYTNNKNDTMFYQRGNHAITLVMFFIGLTLIFGKDIFAILLGEKYRESAYILPFLIFNPIMYTISETTVSGLVFMKKSKMQVVVALGACVTNIIGNIILVPIIGCQGAAISTGISYIIFFSLRTILSNKYFYVDFKLKRFYLLTFITGVYAFYNTFTTFNMWSAIGYFVCIMVMSYLYKDTVRWGIEYISSIIKSFIKSKKGK